jgi:hypothetical protein
MTDRDNQVRISVNDVNSKISEYILFTQGQGSNPLGYIIPKTELMNVLHNRSASFVYRVVGTENSYFVVEVVSDPSSLEKLSTTLVGLADQSVKKLSIKYDTSSRSLSPEEVSLLFGQDGLDGISLSSLSAVSFFSLAQDPDAAEVIVDHIHLREGRTKVFRDLADRFDHSGR